MFLSVSRDQFEDDRPVGERRLRRQEHGSDRAAPQPGQQAKIPETLANVRTTYGQRIRCKKLVAFEQNTELAGPLGKAPEQLLRRRRLSMFLTKVDLFVDDFQGFLRLVPEVGG